ncbi:MAG: MogA/MoaB family molybdenum cofactor biosynthesis protein [Pirellulales bacterium]
MLNSTSAFSQIQIPYNRNVWIVGIVRETGLMGDFSSKSAIEHRQQAPNRICCAVLTVSDTRKPENDRGGQAICQLLHESGHAVELYQIVPDEPGPLTMVVQQSVAQVAIDAILVTGGTGIALRDQTPDTIENLYTKTLPGYGELFRMLSYQEIGSAALLSRASGGLIDRTVVLTMPGSPAAVRLAMEKLILPELAHLVEQARR